MAVNNSLVKKSKAQQNLGITAYLTQDSVSFLLSYQHITPTLHFRSAQISRFFQQHFLVRVYSFHHLHSSDITIWSRSIIPRQVPKRHSFRWDTRDISSLRSDPVSIRD